MLSVSPQSKDYYDLFSSSKKNCSLFSLSTTSDYSSLFSPVAKKGVGSCDDFCNKSPQLDIKNHLSFLVCKLSYDYVQQSTSPILQVSKLSDFEEPIAANIKLKHWTSPSCNIVKL